MVRCVTRCAATSGSRKCKHVQSEVQQAADATPVVFELFMPIQSWSQSVLDKRNAGKGAAPKSQYVARKPLYDPLRLLPYMETALPFS